jgi:hypothetical protein
MVPKTAFLGVLCVFARRLKTFVTFVLFVVIKF